MLSESSRKDIEKVSLELLKQSKSFDIFPTPVEQIVQHSEFITETGIDLRNVKNSFFDRLKEQSANKFRILQSGLAKVRGFFDRTEKSIYVDLGQSNGRQNFVKLHEVGHGVLPWQNEVLLALDNDKTLIANVEDEFEAEANYFASVTLFQHDRFLMEINKLPLSISSSMALAKQFGSSVHSALRNYVIRSPKRCALLVLSPINNNLVNGSICKKRNVFYSESFITDIGKLSLPDNFGLNWAFVQDFKFNRRFNEKGSISLQNSIGEEVNSNYHYFFNTYNIFVFIFPKGESNAVNTKVYLRNIQ